MSEPKIVVYDVEARKIAEWMRRHGGVKVWRDAEGNYEFSPLFSTGLHGYKLVDEIRSPERVTVRVGVEIGRLPLARIPERCRWFFTGSGGAPMGPMVRESDNESGLRIPCLLAWATIDPENKQVVLWALDREEPLDFFEPELSKEEGVDSW